MRKRVWIGVAALVLVAAGLLAAFPQGAARFALASLAGLATGYRFEIAQVHLGSQHGALIGVHISRGSQTVLTARRIDIYYNLRDLLPGSLHRYGLRAVTIDRPQITLVHNPDGTYNVVFPSAQAAPRAPVLPNPIPIDAVIRIRDGSATLIDQHRFYKGSRVQRVERIDADLVLNTVKVTRYTVTGVLQDSGPQPFRFAGRVDYVRGYALHHFSIRAIPIRSIGNYFIDSPAAEILAGSVQSFDAQMYAFDVKPNVPVTYHLIGGGMMRAGRIFVPELASPIAGINGPIRVFDGGFAARQLTANVGRIPVVFAGGIFDFRDPQFRLGVLGHGDVSNLRDITTFAKALPIHGPVAIRTLIEGPIATPLILIEFNGRRFEYQAIPIDNPRGMVALYQNSLIVLPFHGNYSGLSIHIEGSLALGPPVKSILAVHAIGSSSRIPYLGGLVPAQPIDTEALVTGQDLRVSGRGYIVSLNGIQNFNGFYAIDQYGRGAFGPIAVRTPGGGSLVAEFDLDRPHGNSAFWLSLRGVSLQQPQPIVLPGVAIPQLPPMNATIRRAEIAGTGSGRNAVIGGTIDMSPATISGVRFDSIRAQFAGPFAAAAISEMRATGSWGSFKGTGSFSPQAVVARGSFTGTLQGLQPFFGSLPARGSVSGPIAIGLANGKIYVQAQRAQLRDATIDGIPVQSVSGTMAYDNGVLRIYSAQADAAGGNVVAAGSIATQAGAASTGMAIATTQLDAAALVPLGVPLQSGNLTAVGTIFPGSVFPGLDAGIVLRNGRAQNYGPVNASAEISIADDALTLRDGTADFGQTFADVSGTIGALSSAAHSYAVQTRVPVGDLEQIATLLHVPTHGATGMFDANVLIGGNGSDPSINGSIGIPVGQINGLGFSDLRGTIAAGRGGVSISHGTVRVVSTVADFSATVATGETALQLSSPRANLADFNDYFDTGDTLAGTGPLALAFTQYGSSLFTAGDLDVAGLRYRSLPIGDTLAHWTSLRNVVHETLTVGGPHGLLRTAGTIAFAHSMQLPEIVKHSRYDLNASLSNLDLTTWLPALGFPQVPLTGRVNGSARVTGSYPHLALSGNAAISGGTIGPLPIQRAEITARSTVERITVTRLLFALPSLNVTGNGSFGFAETAPMSFLVHATTDNLPDLIAQATKKHIDVGGHIEATLQVGGTFKRPSFNAAFAATNFKTYGLAVPSLAGQVALRGRDLVLRNAQAVFAKGRIAVAGSIPLQLQPFTLGPPSAPIAMDFRADALDLSPFGVILGNDTKLGGTLNGRVAVSGSVGAPRIYGQLGLASGSYVSALETIPITATTAQLAFGGTSATLTHLQARPGGGTLSGNGRLSFGSSGLQGGPLGYSLALKAVGAQLNLPKYGSGTIDASLSLTRVPNQLAVLAGDASLRNAVIPFAAFLQFGGSPGAQAAGPPLNLGFNLNVTAGKNVIVRGGGGGIFGLAVSATGSAALTGTLLQPKLSGRFDSTGGTLTYIDHAFKVRTGSVTFNPANGVIPDVYAVGTTHVLNPDPDTARNQTGSADITATVRGPVTSPKVSFTSNPPGYTEQQIVALLLPLGGFVGPIQFTQTGVILPPGQLNGAPAPDYGGLLPSNVLVRGTNGTLTVGEEAFNILNAQFASGLLSPIETTLTTAFGLSEVNLTVNYTGTFGVNVRRALSKDFYALYGTTFNVPVRQTFGFVYQPNQFMSAQFSMFVQQSTVPPYLSPAQLLQTNPRAAAGQALQGTNGFTFLYQRLF